MFRAFLLAIFFVCGAAAYAADASCISTAIKAEDKPCSGISANSVVAGSKKGAAPANPANVQPDPAAAINMPIPVGVVLKFSADKKTPR